MTRRNFVKTAATGFAATASSYKRILGANGRIRVGMIGPGNQGQGLYRDVLGKEGVDVVVACDVFEPIRERAKHIAKSLGKSVETHGDFRDVLTRPDIDAVVIATPDHWHAYMVVEACKARKDVYVEKPTSVAVRESQQMVQAARKYGRIVQVGTQQRSSGIFQRAVKIAQSKEIMGRISLIKTWINHDKALSQTNANLPRGLDWNMWLGPAPYRPYDMNRFGMVLDEHGLPVLNKDGYLIRHSTFRYWWDYAGGYMTDWGVHLVDIPLWIMRCRGPREITAMGGNFLYRDRETPDTLKATFVCDDFVCEFEHLPANPRSVQQDHGIQVVGEQAVLDVSRFGWKLQFYKGEQPETVHIGGEEIPVEGRQEQYDYTGKNHIDNWLDCIRSRELPLSDIEIGHRATVICHLGNIAYRTKSVLGWDPVNERLVKGPTEAHKLLSRAYRKPWKLEI